MTTIGHQHLAQRVRYIIQVIRHIYLGILQFRPLRQFNRNLAILIPTLMLALVVILAFLAVALFLFGLLFFLFFVFFL
ncbi:MAG: hypothetical protein RO469_13740 [Thermincola sp.]|nr:hypothetical protein [Thermincola sp.]MDT3701623.1 hypothetical protein [Thermincola sp.]